MKKAPTLARLVSRSRFSDVVAGYRASQGPQDTLICFLVVHHICYRENQISWPVIGLRWHQNVPACGSGASRGGRMLHHPAVARAAGAT